MFTKQQFRFILWRLNITIFIILLCITRTSPSVFPNEKCKSAKSINRISSTTQSGPHEDQPHHNFKMLDRNNDPSLPYITFQEAPKPETPNILQLMRNNKILKSFYFILPPEFKICISDDSLSFTIENEIGIFTLSDLPNRSYHRKDSVFKIDYKTKYIYVYLDKFKLQQENNEIFFLRYYLKEWGFPIILNDKKLSKVQSGVENFNEFITYLFKNSTSKNIDIESPIPNIEPKEIHWNKRSNCKEDHKDQSTGDECCICHFDKCLIFKKIRPIKSK